MPRELLAPRHTPAPCSRTPAGALRCLSVDPEPGEEVFFHGHPSWRSLALFYVKGLLASLLIGIAAGLASAIADRTVQAGWVVAVVLVVFVILFLVGQIRRLQTTYTITNQRLTIETGLLTRELHETRLERVQNVNSHQTLAQRVLSVGAVDFDTAAGAEYNFSFRGVSHPRQIVRTVDRALRELRATHKPDADAGV
jgi:uncharacterized membrane protein YdbT with pleckstrin-like domain